MADSQTVLPRARTESITVRELDGETIIYDLDSHRVSCLNAIAGLVWKACDGAHSLQDMGTLVHQQLGLGHRDAPTAVQQALQELAAADLLATPLPDTVAQPRHPMLTRRQLFFVLGGATLGGAALAAPFVITMLAPKAAHAASCTTSGGSCTSHSQCCSGECLGNLLCS